MDPSGHRGGGGGGASQYPHPHYNETPGNGKDRHSLTAPSSLPGRLPTATDHRTLPSSLTRSSALTWGASVSRLEWSQAHAQPPPR